MDVHRGHLDKDEAIGIPRLSSKISPSSGAHGSAFMIVSPKGSTNSSAICNVSHVLLSNDDLFINFRLWITIASDGDKHG